MLKTRFSRNFKSWPSCHLTTPFPTVSVTILELAPVHSLHYAPRLYRSFRVALVSHAMPDGYHHTAQDTVDKISPKSLQISADLFLRDHPPHQPALI